MTKQQTDPIMLSGMTDCLAVAVENAVIIYGETVESFMQKFIDTGLADSFSEQAPFVTTGCTGEELVAMVNEKSTGIPGSVKGVCGAEYSVYYWVGYAIALFVAEYGTSVKKLMAVIPPPEWLRLYSLYHEYGDELLIEKLNNVYTVNGICDK